MIQKQTMLKVADNSGAKSLMVIQVKGSTGRRFAGLGDEVKVTVKKAIPGGTVKKSEVLDAVIVRTRKETGRKDGSFVRSDRTVCLALPGKAVCPGREVASCVP